MGCPAVLEPGFKRYAYPLPAHCLLGVHVTIRILNEMRLNHSPIHAGFAYKTTEQLCHSRALCDALCAARMTQFLYRLTSQNRARVGPFLDSCESVCKDEGVVKDRILLSGFVTPPASLHSFCLSCTPRFSIRCLHRFAGDRQTRRYRCAGERPVQDSSFRHQHDESEADHDERQRDQGGVGRLFKYFSSLGERAMKWKNSWMYNALLASERG